MRVLQLTAWHVRIPLRKPIQHASHTRSDTDNLIVRCTLRRVSEDSLWIAEVRVVVHLHKIIVLRQFPSDVREQLLNDVVVFQILAEGKRVRRSRGTACHLPHVSPV